MEPRLEHFFSELINQCLQPIKKGLIFNNLLRMDYISKIQYLFCSFLKSSSISIFRNMIKTFGIIDTFDLDY